SIRAPTDARSEARGAGGDDRRSNVMTPSPLRVALYARVSSQQQAEANTIGSQVEALQARIRADGLRVAAAARFLDEGYSAGTLLRPALERRRDQAAAGSLDRLYVHSPDGWRATTPCKSYSWTSGSGPASKSSFSTAPSGHLPKKICFCKCKG